MHSGTYIMALGHSRFDVRARANETAAVRCNYGNNVSAKLSDGLAERRKRIYTRRRVKV